MDIKKYNKLIRDKIPEIIEINGGRCEVEILEDDEYINMLEAKLDEEVSEYHNDKNLEELADIIEVVLALAGTHGYSVEELENFRLKKAEKRGTFEKKLLLKSTEYPE